eukprot:m51a1_g12392 putative domain-containing protein (832) ;mRNA; f:664105-667435
MADVTVALSNPLASTTLTSFDFEAGLLCDILGELESVSEHFGQGASALGRLSRSFSDYAARLSSIERSGRAPSALGALGKVVNALEGSASSLSEQVAALCVPLKQYLGPLATAQPLHNRTRTMTVGRVRPAAAKFEPPNKPLPVPPPPRRPLPLPVQSPADSPPEPQPLGPPEGPVGALSTAEEFAECPENAGESCADAEDSRALSESSCAPPSEASRRRVPSEECSPLPPAPLPPPQPSTPAPALPASPASSPRVMIGAARVAGSVSSGALMGGGARAATAPESAPARHSRFFSESSAVAAQVLPRDHIVSVAQRAQECFSTFLATVADTSRMLEGPPMLKAGITELLELERSQLAKLTSLIVLYARARQKDKLMVFEGEEEMRLVFGPLEEAMELHMSTMRSITGVETLAPIVETYLRQLGPLGSVYVDMMSTGFQACAVASGPKKKQFFKAHTKEDFATLRLSPLNYVRSLEKQLWKIQRSVLGSDPAYAVLQEAMKPVRELIERVEDAKSLSESQVYLIDLQNTISGLEDVVVEGRKYLGVVELAYAYADGIDGSMGIIMKHKLYLFSDMLVLTSISEGVESLAAKGRLLSLMISEVGRNDLCVWWSKGRSDDKVRVGFDTEERRDRWALKIRDAITKAYSLQVFGVGVDDLIQREKDRAVPRVLSDAVDYLMQNGLATEGLFRVSIPASQLRKLQTNIDSGRQAKYTCPNEAADVIRAWLRALPVPLLEAGSIDWAAAGAAIVSGERTAMDTKDLVAQLPEGRRRVAACLFRLFQAVDRGSEANRMTAKNLAVVFAPSVLKVTEVPTLKHFAVVEALIQYADVLFE